MKTLILLLTCITFATSGFSQPNEQSPKEVRQYYVESLVKIADPVLTSLSENKLKEQMPIEQPEYGYGNREKVTYLEAFGRLLSGIAPWLELGADDSEEGRLRAKYIQLAQQGIQNATDPNSPDFMNFDEGAQPLVDAAFFAQGLLRAPTQLWDPLPEETKQNVIKALKSSRKITPYNNNWMLFTGMVEAALLQFDQSEDRFRMQQPIQKHMEWYLGDGMYGDGPNFHWDYYNSYVIQPMMLDILKAAKNAGWKNERQFNTVLKRAKRYAEIQERLISPEGTYPPIGRSLAYRFGAFQALSQIALWQELPDEFDPAQVRSALYAVIKRQLETPGTFDENGWLQLGFNGHQKNIAEGYISTGSLYLCSEVFLALGLPADTPFWSNEAAPWTQKKIWELQEAIPIDKAE